MNNEIKDLQIPIKYNTFDIIQSSLLYTGILISLLNNILIKNNETVKCVANLIASTSMITSLGMSFSGGIEYTKDIIEIKQEYKKFIERYNKLNKIFNLINPVEIYTMFNYLLYKGYLSKDKEFIFSQEKIKEITNNMGLTVITGKAVCRHISAMLYDIFKNYGIETGQLVMYLRNYKIDVKLKDDTFSKEELIKWIENYVASKETQEKLYDLVNKAEKYGFNLEFLRVVKKEENYVELINGNHAITYAFQNDKSYFLDPTQFRIYRQNELNIEKLYDKKTYQANIIFQTTKSINTNKNDCRKMIKRIKNNHKTLNKDEEEKIIQSTQDLCKNNLDIFEQFYNYNKDFYNDLSSKFLKLKIR